MLAPANPGTARSPRRLTARYDPAMRLLTIGQLARAAAVPTSTLRFYERAALLKPDARTPANYRAYTPHALDRLRFIRSAQATGLSLHDIKDLLALTTSPQPPCAEVLALMQKRLADVRQRLKQLRHVEKTLAQSLQSCCKGAAPDLCQTVYNLKRR
jgi:MerR family mercuric resistance operon transcriptional regulator